MKNYKIVVTRIDYVGLSIAALLVLYHQVAAMDVVPGKVEMVNNKKSSIQDEYIEKFLFEKELNLTVTLDGAAALPRCRFFGHRHSNEFMTP